MADVCKERERRPSARHRSRSSVRESLRNLFRPSNVRRMPQRRTITTIDDQSSSGSTLLEPIVYAIKKSASDSSGRRQSTSDGFHTDDNFTPSDFVSSRPHSGSAEAGGGGVNNAVDDSERETCKTILENSICWQSRWFVAPVGDCSIESPGKSSPGASGAESVRRSDEARSARRRSVWLPETQPIVNRRVGGREFTNEEFLSAQETFHSVSSGRNASSCSPFHQETNAFPLDNSPNRPKSPPLPNTRFPINLTLQKSPPTPKHPTPQDSPKIAQNQNDQNEASPTLPTNSPEREGDSLICQDERGGDVSVELNPGAPVSVETCTPFPLEQSECPAVASPQKDNSALNNNDLNDAATNDEKTNDQRKNDERVPPEKTNNDNTIKDNTTDETDVSRESNHVSHDETDVSHDRMREMEAETSNSMTVQSEQSRSDEPQRQVDVSTSSEKVRPSSAMSPHEVSQERSKSPARGRPRPATASLTQRDDFWITSSTRAIEPQKSAVSPSPSNTRDNKPRSPASSNEDGDPNSRDFNGDLDVRIGRVSPETLDDNKWTTKSHNDEEQHWQRASPERIVPSPSRSGEMASPSRSGEMASPSPSRLMASPSPSRVMASPSPSRSGESPLSEFCESASCEVEAVESMVDSEEGDGYLPIPLPSGIASECESVTVQIELQSNSISESSNAFPSSSSLMPPETRQFAPPRPPHTPSLSTCSRTSPMRIAQDNFSNKTGVRLPSLGFEPFESTSYPTDRATPQFRDSSNDPAFDEISSSGHCGRLGGCLPSRLTPSKSRTSPSPHECAFSSSPPVPHRCHRRDASRAKGRFPPPRVSLINEPPSPPPQIDKKKNDDERQEERENENYHPGNGGMRSLMQVFSAVEDAAMAAYVDGLKRLQRRGDPLASLASRSCGREREMHCGGERDMLRSHCGERDILRSHCGERDILRSHCGDREMLRPHCERDISKFHCGGEREFLFGERHLCEPRWSEACMEVVDSPWSMSRCSSLSDSPTMILSRQEAEARIRRFVQTLTTRRRLSRIRLLQNSATKIQRWYRDILAQRRIAQSINCHRCHQSYRYQIHTSIHPRQPQQQQQLYSKNMEARGMPCIRRVRTSEHEGSSSFSSSDLESWQVPPRVRMERQDFRRPSWVGF